MSADFDKWFFAAAALYHRAQKEIGRAEAQRAFEMVCKPATPKQRAGWRNMELVMLYDCMEPRPNAQRLAREIADKNKALPKDERYGPRGGTDPAVIERHLRRLLARRNSKRREQMTTAPARTFQKSI